jgi:tetratricopeptide (TPR) repeat protein
MREPIRDGLERLTSGPSALLRFVLVPGIVVMTGVILLGSSDELAAPQQRYPGYALAIVMLLLAVGAWDPVRHRWALRVFAAMTSLVSAGYLVHALSEHEPGQSSIPSGWAEVHPVNAALAFVAFGLPATLFAALGRFPRWRSPPAPPSPVAAHRGFHWAHDQPPPPARARGDIARAIVLGIAPFAAAAALALGAYVLIDDGDPQPHAGPQQAAKRGVPDFKPGPPLPPEIPDGPPFLGEEGSDAFGYPLRRPDSTVLLALLQAQRYAELDAAMLAYQQAFEGDPRKEAWPLMARDSFAIAAPEVGTWLDAWIEASPESFGAWAARGAWHDAMGWSLRGTRYARETPEAQFVAMGVRHEDARADFERAFALRPKYVAALHGLLSIASTGGDDAVVQARYDQAIEICAECFRVRVAYVLARSPKWGGSYQLMDDAAAKAPVRRNRKLAALAGLSAYERCRTLRGEKNLEAALKQCEASERKGALISVMCERAEIINQQKRYADALPIVNQALRLDPQEQSCLKAREVARRRTKDFVGAAQDVLMLRRLDPFDEKLEPVITFTMQRLRYDAAQAAKAGRTDEETQLRALANAIVPGGGDARHPGGVAEDELAELQLGVAEAPDDFDLRLRLDGALAARGRFDEIVAMWDVFIDAHPDHARAWEERGGAKWHARDHEGAIADTARACELGSQRACDTVPKLRARAGG